MADSADLSDATRAALVAAAAVHRRNLIPRRVIAHALAESLRDPSRSFLQRLPSESLSQEIRSEIEGEPSSASSPTPVPDSSLASLLVLLPELEDPALRSTLESALRFLGGADHPGTMAGPAEREIGTLLQPMTPEASAATVVGPMDEFATRHGGPARNSHEPHSAFPAPPGGSRFVVLRPLAKGGLGQVLVARDTELHREVALKEILPDHSSRADSRHRFLLEAEITGRLEHPGVVPVYGLGRYPDGRPYYAMKFIVGESFLDALRSFHAALKGPPTDGEALTRFRHLLSRFVNVCHTMHFAHTRGILHRDLKPANIMLGEFGETLVVDWGLAKALGETGLSSGSVPASEETGTGTTVIEPVLSGSGSETREGSVLGTPAYMSPEQASSDLAAMGPASDIYSLGATLYCILTGRPPFQGKKVHELVRRVSAGEFDPPRTVLPWIPPALDAIVRRAMAQDPANRYRTARALADDLERFLADEPVTALPENRAMRAARWLRRHRTFVATGTVALFVVAIVSLAAALVVNSARQREAAAKERAVALFAQARSSVDTWMSGVAEIARFYPGVQRTRERLLVEAAKAYSGFAKESPRDPLLRLEQVRTLIRLADVQQTLADYAAAQITLERTREVLDGLAREQHPPVDWLLEAGRVSSRLALAKGVQGVPSEGDEQFRLAGEFFRRYRAVRPDSESLALADATTAATWAELLVQGDRLDEADRQLVRARELFPQAERGGQPDAARSGLAQVFALSGQVAERRERWDEALAWFEAGLRALGELRERTGDPVVLDRLAGARVRQAAVFRALGREQDEAKAYESAIQDYSDLVSAFPDVPHLRENLALTRVDLAQLLERNAQSRSGRAPVSEAIAELRRLTSAPDPLPRYFETLAAALSTFGRIEGNLGGPQPAEAAFREATELYKLLSREYPEVAAYRIRGAVTAGQWARLVQDRHAEQATELWNSLEPALRPLLDQDPPDAVAGTILAAALTEWGFHDHRAGRVDAAGERLRHAAELLGDGAGTVERFEAVVRLLCDGPGPMRDVPKAAALADDALVRWPLSATVRLTAGRCRLAAGDGPEAERLAREARRQRGFDHPGDLFVQALAIAKQPGRLDEARRLAGEGLAVFESQGPHDPDWMPLAIEVRRLAGPAAKAVPEQPAVPAQ